MGLRSLAPTTVSDAGPQCLGRRESQVPMSMSLHSRAFPNASRLRILLTVGLAVNISVRKKPCAENGNLKFSFHHYKTRAPILLYITYLTHRRTGSEIWDTVTGRAITYITHRIWRLSVVCANPLGLPEGVLGPVTA